MRSERLPDAVHDVATAMVFLTRIPIPWQVPDLDARLPRCTPWFPLVGVLVGAMGALAWWLGASAGNALIGAIAAVAATALVTGAFHEDGLADTFDGLGGSPGRERALTIMKDSRIGAFGTVALVLVLLARIGALLSLGGAAVAALIGAHALARLSSLPLIRWLPYARADGGTGKPFAGGVSDIGLAVAVGATALLTLVLWGASALVVWLVVALLVGVTGWWYYRRLGGITGDTLGATNQFVELGCYLALVAML